jgi:three-Cys-motif partner protein
MPLELHPDPCPELLVERGSTNEGVGSWVPEQKHLLLHKYLIGTQYAWRKWPSRVFIDPFSGPGRIQVKGESSTRDGGAVVAWRALQASAPFTKMLVGDIDGKRAIACEQRLKALGAPAMAFTGPAIDTVPMMVGSVPTNSLCLAYIDPYNLEHLSYSILQALAPLKIDLAINFSTMDLERNVDFETDPDRARFDGTAPGWRERPEIKVASRSNLPMKFFDYWREIVGDLGFVHSKEMPLVTNDQGRPIYRMVFFSRHELPNRIWGDVARGPNRDLDLFD